MVYIIYLFFAELREMDELKNLVIQSLETNGVLGQVRAQLRSCVFKVIDN